MILALQACTSPIGHVPNVDHAVTYHANGASSGTVPVDSAQYREGASVSVLGNIGNLALTDFRFDSWNSQADGTGTKYLPGQTLTMPAADLTLYARWTSYVLYKLTFDPNGAESGIAPADLSVGSGSSLTVPNNTGSLAKTGFVLAGWNTKADGLGTSYAVGSVFVMPAAVTILYAQWAVPHSITFHANSGTGTMAAQTLGENMTAALSANSFTSTSATFAGWATTASASTAEYLNSAAFTMGNADVTLYAVWKSWFSYTLSGTNATITGLSTDWDGTTAIDIPSTIAGNTVVAIAENAFQAKKTLTSVVIPNSVSSIGRYAFYECSNVTSLTLSNTIAKISDGAFMYCLKLAELNIPDSVTSIESQAFANCNELATIVFGSGLTTIKQSAFYLIKATSIDLPASLTTIADYAFNSCNELTSISIPASNAAFTTDDGILYNKDKTVLLRYPVKKAGAFAIATSVVTINPGACEQNTSWTTLNFPASLKTIKSGAFYQCTGLTSLIIPSSLTTIEQYAFSKCGELNSLLINEGLVTIGLEAFGTCRKITAVSIPASVTSLAATAFYLCTSLPAITVADANPNYSSADGVVFNKAKTTPLIYPEGKTTASYAFPATVTSIPSQAMRNNYLTSLTIPSSVTSIGGYAFYHCNKLSALRVEAAAVPSAGTSIVSSYTIASITVPSASLADYKAATNWSGFATIIVAY